jgi:DNA-binding HxlR family transcriptional regulator
MRWLDLSTENCSIQRTLDLVGERWTLLVLREAANGVRRFQDFHEHVGLSRPLLADRLRKLVAAGILETQPYREGAQRPRHEYRLTAKGWDLHPALVALMQWGDAYLADPEGPPVRLRHRDCEHEIRVTVSCGCGDQELGPPELAVEPGPSARPR